MLGAAAATASPVPRASCWTARSTPSGRTPASARSGPPTTTTRSAPAARAAATGQRTSGRPHTGWSTLGVSERMRVPCPAAMITTVGPATRGRGYLGAEEPGLEPGLEGPKPPVLPITPLLTRDRGDRRLAAP